LLKRRLFSFKLIDCWDLFLSLIILIRFANIHNIARLFIFVLSSIVLIVSLLGRFTDFVPTTFQIKLYVFYQSGITIGIFLITRRKEHDVLSEIKWWYYSIY